MDYGDERLPLRFWDKVYPEPNTGCWLWGAGISWNGYGVTSSDSWPKKAHRWVAEVEYGHHDGKIVMHSCDMPACVNPDHLSWATTLDNVRDRYAKKRDWQSNRSKCPRNHEYNEGNTYRPSSGGRQCKICRRDLARARRLLK